MKNESEISLPIVKKEKTLTYKIVFGLNILIYVITIISYVESSDWKEVFLIVSFVFSIFSSLFIDIRSLKIKEFTVFGDIKLTEDKIIITNDAFESCFNVDDLIEFKISINETSRDPKGYMEGKWGINKFKDGVNNSIEFKTINSEYFKVEVLIADNQIIEKLDSYLKSYRKPFSLFRNGVKIKSIKDEHYKDYPIEFIDTRIN